MLNNWKNLKSQLSLIALLVIVLLSVSIYFIVSDNNLMALIKLTVSILIIAFMIFAIRRIARHTESSFIKMEKEKTEAEEHLTLMLDAGPLCWQVFDCDYNIIDCNEAAVNFFGFDNKQEFLEKWPCNCSPEFQLDGQRSDEKANAYLKKAFEEGRCVFDWTFQTTGGMLIPGEVTLVRVKHQDSCIVAAFTRDLREVKKLEEKVKEIYFDALTGIHNRRHLDENLDRLIKPLSRSGSSLSVMMIDIDRFKQYNDTYGHDAGDNCLRTVAEILSKSITRTEDFVVRYGGEEFVAILPNTDESGARMVAEKMLENIRNCKIPHISSDIAEFVTFSIGVTAGKADYTQNSADYIKYADKMLYEAKRNGRNRYIFAPLDNIS